MLEQAHRLWPVFELIQPLNGAVFALDEILIGAGDVRYPMWSVGVWAALLALIVVRLATPGIRFRRRRWLVTGWA